MSEHKPITSTPVPVRRRHDGWTAERQIAFIDKLADCGSVSAAGEACRNEPRGRAQAAPASAGRAFRDAWGAALDRLAYARAGAHVSLSVPYLFSMNKSDTKRVTGGARPPMTRAGMTACIDEGDRGHGSAVESHR